MTLDEYLEKLVLYYTGNEFTEEVKLAKAEFFERAGIVDEHDASFDVRMSQFLDWYVFSRPLSSLQKTPIEVAGGNGGFLKLEDEFKWLAILSHTKHSLFEFIKIKNEDVYIKDIMAGKKIIIKKSPIVVGFSPDEIFDARLIPVNDSFVFTKGFCFHPPGARKYITKEIKRVKKLENSEKEQMMLKLLKMRYRFEQYKHVEVTQIYTDDSKLKY